MFLLFFFDVSSRVRHDLKGRGQDTSPLRVNCEKNMSVCYFYDVRNETKRSVLEKDIHWRHWLDTRLPVWCLGDVCVGLSTVCLTRFPHLLLLHTQFLLFLLWVQMPSPSLVSRLVLMNDPSLDSRLETDLLGDMKTREGTKKGITGQVFWPSRQSLEYVFNKYSSTH